LIALTNLVANIPRLLNSHLDSEVPKCQAVEVGHDGILKEGIGKRFRQPLHMVPHKS
jgi:hypothetical protein